jgi:NAD(P)-dependent dehydrogenase (short-subunit alcohol dehydrogenase family)
MFDLRGKIAVVTGGGSGIGRAISQSLAGAGAHVFVLDYNANAAAETVSLIQEKQGLAEPIAINVSNQAEMVKVAQNIVQTHQRLDIWVNNAGVSHIGNVENTSEADFNRVFEVNVKGVYNGIFAAVPAMKAQGGGVILNMCSIVGSVGIPDRFAYSMSKGAVLTMTLSTAKDYVKHNIRCNCISPARVHTPFVDGYLAQHYPDQQPEMFAKLAATQPIGRMAKPEEIGSLALFLCSDEASFITGSDYPIDGGFIRINN